MLCKILGSYTNVYNPGQTLLTGLVACNHAGAADRGVQVGGAQIDTVPIATVLLQIKSKYCLVSKALSKNRPILSFFPMIMVRVMVK